MDDKKAAEVLLRLLNKGQLDEEEKEAIQAAIGILGWTALSQSRIKKIKDRREQATK